MAVIKLGAMLSKDGTIPLSIKSMKDSKAEEIAGLNRFASEEHLTIFQCYVCHIIWRGRNGKFCSDKTLAVADFPPRLQLSKYCGKYDLLNKKIYIISKVIALLARYAEKKNDIKKVKSSCYCVTH